MNKQRMIVEWSPHDPTLFAVGADNLRLYESTSTDAYHGSHADDAHAATTTQRKRSFQLIKFNAQVNAQNSQLKCMEWYPFDAKPQWIATGMGNGKVMLTDFEDPRSRIVREFSPKYTRPCNAVAWNHAAPHQLAAGFEKVRSDYCTLVWDLNVASSGSTIMGSARGRQSESSLGSGLAGALVGTPLNPVGGEDLGVSILGGGAVAGIGVGGGITGGSTSTMRGVFGRGSVGGHSSGFLGASSGGGGGGGGKDTMQDRPVHELSNSEATVALSWVPLQPSCLAVGTGFKWLRIYDLRATMNGAAPLSVVAHNKAVLGVVFDRHRPHVLATYTDSPQEPIKVWDIRRLDTNLGPLVSLHASSKTLAQVSWCPTKAGILATASVEERYLSLWDVSKHDAVGPNGAMQIKKPFKRRYTSEPLTAFSWQCVQQTPSSMSRRRDKNGSAAHARLAAAAFPNRLLTASVSGGIEDISMHDSLPISLSPTGSLAFSCGQLLFSGSAISDRSGTRHSSRQPAAEEDIAPEMLRLAKARYSMVVEKNLRLVTVPNPSPRQRQLRSLWQWVHQVEALRRIQGSRVAQMRGAAGQQQPQQAGAPLNPLRGWPIDPAMLTMVGVKHLLNLSGESPHELAKSPPSSAVRLGTIHSSMKTDTTIGCVYYEGPGRRLALYACNWDPDRGQSASTDFSGGLPPRQGGLTLNRSSSGAWMTQRQFEDGTAQFGARSANEFAHHELRHILTKCESEGNYSRGAALAVFHGDLVTAVSILQRGATWLIQMQHGSMSVPYSADVLQLVAMAVAGFSTVANAASGGTSMWATMCQQLLRREEITSQHYPRYLHALLSFLCAAASPSAGAGSTRANMPPPPAPRRGAGANNRKPWGSVDGLSVLAEATRNSISSGGSGNYSAILYDVTLPLGDRVAFACRFLPPEQLRSFITQCDQECQQLGRLDGILLTGLASDGVQLLQRYLDKTGDVQTLALLAARLPSAYVAKHAPVLEQWITVYQDLLNQWRVFHERARFDVARSQHEDVLAAFANYAKDPDAEELNQELNAPPTLTIPPQLYVRCNFCNHSLSLANLLRLGGSQSSWLNRAKPKLSCCPSCRKPLPQCALCLLPLGALNPYLELAHRRSKQTAEAVAASIVSDPSATTGGLAVIDDALSKIGNESLSQLSSIPFVEWFTWCQSCKHGGHAHHIADWFATHSVCPVTDCSCQCQHADLPIALQKRQEDRRLQHESDDDEQAQEDDTHHNTGQLFLPHQHPGDGANQRGLGGPASGPNAKMATPPRPSTTSPPRGSSRQDVSVSRQRRGSRSQQQLPQQNSSMLSAGQATPRMLASRAATPLLTGASTAGVDGLSLSSKLDQLDKEKGTSFFL